MNMCKFIIPSGLLAVWVGCIGSLNATAEAPAAKTPSGAEQTLARAEILKRMAEVYENYKALQVSLGSQATFFSARNEPRISRLLTELSRDFAELKTQAAARGKEPGFAAALHTLQDDLQDGLERFKEGKKSYAYWRLRSIGDYCVSCHTRFEMAPPVMNITPPAEVKRSPIDEAEFYFATAQYPQAKETFLKAIQDPRLAVKRSTALRKLLILFCRAHENPQEGLKTLLTIQRDVLLSGYERELVEGWIAAFRRWQNETPNPDPGLEDAERLLRRGLQDDDPLSGGRGSVELLRATTILHRLLDKQPSPKPEARARALYLLGLAYSELSFFFPPDLPELFLEQAIRRAPGTPDARRAYRRLKLLTSANYTGSSGTHVPAEVEKNLEDLYELAYMGKSE